MKQQLVIVGNGMAPGRMLEELFEREPNAYDVTIFGSSVESVGELHCIDTQGC